MRLSHIRAVSPKEPVPVPASAEAFRRRPAKSTKRGLQDRRISHGPGDAARAERAWPPDARGQGVSRHLVPPWVVPAFPAIGDRSETALGGPRLDRRYAPG